LADAELARCGTLAVLGGEGHGERPVTRRSWITSVASMAAEAAEAVATVRVVSSLSPIAALTIERA
jgi:hypothetical protein